MSSVGTGVGGNVGGPLIPLQRDIETTAWTEVNKAALGIVPDSIERAFQEISPRYTFGYLGGFGYRSAAENPLLDHPLESVRFTQASLSQESTDAWRGTYNQLLDRLPADLAARLLRERSLPFESRNLSFTALDNLLVITAKIFSRAQTLGEAEHLGALEEMRTTLNIMLPFAALRGSIANGSEVLLEARRFLIDQGPNYLYFDGFNELSTQLERAITLLDRVNGSLDHTTSGQLTPEAMKDAAKAATILASISLRLERISFGNDLQLLLPTVNALELVATALSLQHTLSAPLFLALAWGSVGLFSSESPLGSLSPQFEALVNAIAAGVTTGVMPSDNRAGNEFLATMLAVSLTTWIGLASLAVDTGLGVYPTRSPQETEAARFFAFEAALQFAVSSGILEAVYKEAIAISGGNPEAQDLGSKFLAQFAHLMMILAGAQAGNQPPDRLVEHVATYILTGIHVAGNVETRIENPQTSDAAIAIKLMALALESRDYAGFLDAYNNFLGDLGIQQDALQTDLNAINNLSKAIAALFNPSDMDANLTGVIHIV